MKAQTLTEIQKPLELLDQSNQDPGPNEVIVEVKAAALNRRDFWITQGMYPGIQPPVVLGSDGAGIVTSVGEQVDSSWLQREVIINPGIGWGSMQKVQSDKFHILGLPSNGTFANQVCVPAENLFAKPDHLSWQQAAALPLAGVTAHRALFYHGGLRPDHSVLITGIGGGVAAFALQFAVAAGASVWVTSSSSEKIERAIALGAKSGYLYTDDTHSKQAKSDVGGFDLIIDSAGGNGYGTLVNLAAPGGMIVNYGSTNGAPEKLDLFKVFWKQLTIRGTSMGSPEDFSEMVKFVETHQMVPTIEKVFSITQVNEAIDQMATSPQFGKYVFEMDW